MSRGPVACTGIATTHGMADLERGCKEFLSPMIVRHEARTLSVNDQVLLATWAVKTVFHA